MKYIKLTNGGETKVDDEDYEFLSQWNWQNSGGYVRRTEYRANKKLANGKHQSINEVFTMHRVINKTPDGFDTDHINGDKLDNQRANLRTATRSQNAHNAGKKNNGSKTLAGVSWRKDRSKWRSYICVDGKDIYLGSFNNQEDAHNIYLNAKEQLLW